MADLHAVVEAIKDRLNDYRSEDREIENQTERLERLLNKMHEVGAQDLTGMPRSPSPDHDRMSDLISKKDELESEVAELRAEHKKERKRIEKIVRKLKRPDERAVIRFRFIDGHEWDEVTDMLFGGRSDFLDREETYQRRTFTLHHDAIYHMAKIVIKSHDDFVDIPE